MISSYMPALAADTEAVLSIEFGISAIRGRYSLAPSASDVPKSP